MVSYIEVMLVYKLPASLHSLRRGFLLAVRKSTDKKPQQVFSSSGTPQWTVPLKKFLRLFDPQTPKIVLQVTRKFQVFTLKSPVKSQVLNFEF